MPLGLEFDYVQLAGQPAPGEREAWNADALMEGVRVGTKEERIPVCTRRQGESRGGEMDPTA